MSQIIRACIFGVLTPGGVSGRNNVTAMVNVIADFATIYNEFAFLFFKVLVPSEGLLSDSWSSCGCWNCANL